MKLDYSTLNQQTTREDVAAFKTWRDSTTRNTLPPLVGKILVFTAALSLLLITINTISSFTNSIATILLLTVLAIGVLSACVVAFLKWLQQQIARQARLYKFALANNAEYILGAKSPAYPGMIFDEGHGRTILDGLRLPDGVEVGNYQYETGSGKNRRTYTWSYASVRLNRMLPHMVLDAKQNNLFGFTNLPDSFSGQKLSLEGDFDKHFTLYAPTAYGRDALYIFTPDVMAALIDFGDAYDIEIIDDYLMFYGKQKLTLDSQQQLESFLRVIELISGELHDQSHRYADERVGEPSLNTIAEPGRRLKKRLTILPFVIIAFVIIISYLLGAM